jgi:hypothetical protein
MLVIKSLATELPRDKMWRNRIASPSLPDARRLRPEK